MPGWARQRRGSQYPGFVGSGFDGSIAAARSKIEMRQTSNEAIARPAACHLPSLSRLRAPPTVRRSQRVCSLGHPAVERGDRKAVNAGVTEVPARWFARLGSQQCDPASLRPFPPHSRCRLGCNRQAALFLPSALGWNWHAKRRPDADKDCWAVRVRTTPSAEVLCLSRQLAGPLTSSLRPCSSFDNYTSRIGFLGAHRVS